MAAQVRVRGLRELSRELGRVHPKLRRALGKAHKKVATDLVVKPAQQRMRRTAKGRGGSLGAAGIKGSARTSSVSIILSGSNPRTLGDEFGARAYRQFRGWRGNQYTDPFSQNVGYAVHPTIRSNRDRILDGYGDAFDDALKGAFPD